MFYTSFEQIENHDFNHARIAREERYRKLWANERPELPKLGTDTSPINTDLNWFRRITEFYVDAITNEPPEIKSTMESENETYMNMTPMLLPQLEKALRWRSIKGLGVLAFSSDNTVRAIDTSHYFPIVNERDVEEVTGHAIIYPYSTKSPYTNLYEDDKSPGSKTRSTIIQNRQLLDRVDIIQVTNGRPSPRVTYNFGGLRIGSKLAESSTNIVAVCTFGDWISEYVDVEGPIKRYENRLYRLDRALDRHSMPHLQGPPEVLDDLRKDENGNVRLVIDEEGEYFPVPEGHQGYSYLTWDPQLATTISSMEELKQFIFVASGVSPSAFGLDASAASGVARERQMVVALQKIRKLKRGIDKCLLEGFNYQGFTSAQINWPEDPFAKYFERVEYLLAEVDRGLLTMEEARRRIDGMRQSFNIT